MSRFRSSSWSYRIDLSPSDKLHLRNVIAAERGYFNALVGSLNGPIRTMPDTLKALTGRWEEVIGLVASTGIDLRSVKANNPGVFAPVANLLFDSTGRSQVDSKTQVFMDIVAQQSGFVASEVRRAMAIEMIRYAREQAMILAGATNNEDQVFKFAVETIVPLDAVSKRHVQLPRSCAKVETEEAAPGAKFGNIKITLPYLSAAITVPEPPLQWNYIVLREDTDGRYTLELSREAKTLYLLKRTDLTQLRRRSKPGVRA